MSRFPCYSFSIYESFKGHRSQRWPAVMAFPSITSSRELSVKRMLRSIPKVRLYTVLIPFIIDESARVIH